MKVNNFEVLKEMSLRSGRIFLAPMENMIRFQSCRAGVQITIGVSNAMMPGLMDGQYCGGLVLADRTEFAEVSRELEQRPDIYALRPLAEYHEDCGTVLWWHVPIQEPPYVGAGPGLDERINGEPTTCASLIMQGYLTHWSAIPNIKGPQL